MCRLEKENIKTIQIEQNKAIKRNSNQETLSCHPLTNFSLKIWPSKVAEIDQKVIEINYKMAKFNNSNNKINLDEKREKKTQSKKNRIK